MSIRRCKFGIFSFSIVFALFMGIVVIVIRMKAQKFPVNEKKIILPPIFMSTGALMYVIPYFRLTGAEILESIILGVIFSSVLIWTSHFEVQGAEVYMKRSKAFPIILISLLIIRTIIKYLLVALLIQEKSEACSFYWHLV